MSTFALFIGVSYGISSSVCLSVFLSVFCFSIGPWVQPLALASPHIHGVDALLAFSTATESVCLGPRQLLVGVAKQPLVG